MIIINEQEAVYPRLHECLCGIEDVARGNPHIVEAIVKTILSAGAEAKVTPQLRQLIEAKLWRALRYGDAPEVIVMDAPGACSQHLQGTNSIVLEKSLVRRFEDAEPGSRGSHFLGQEIKAIFLQSLVHWLGYCCLSELATSEIAPAALADLRETAFQDLSCAT